MHFTATIPLTTFVLALLLSGPALHAQLQPPLGEPDLPLPGQSPTLKPRIVTTLSGPGVYGMPAFKESSVEITATGTPGFTLSIRSLPTMTLPGGQPLSALVQLVDPAPPPTGTQPTSTSSSPTGSPTIAGPVADPRRTAIPEDIMTSRDDSVPTTQVTVRKRLVFRGINRSAVPNPERYFRPFEMEIQATRPGAASVVRRFTVVLSNDEGPPAIVSLSSEASSGSNIVASTDFPPVVEPTGADADLYATKTYKLNWLKLHRKVTIIASNFSVDGERPSADFMRFYRLVTEYSDGTRFAYAYENLGVYPTGPNSRRLTLRVPNIRRGSFRIYLESPFGRTQPSQEIRFQSNQFVTSLPVASAPIVAINVDTPLYVGGFESLFGMAEGAYQYRVLPENPRCDEEYATWDSVSMGRVEIFPVGVASAKFTRSPAANSIVHSGNMPKLTGTAAGLGTLKAHWVGRMKVYMAECADRRL